MFRGGKQTEPQCPSRLDVQVLTPTTWSRAPNHSVKVHRMKMSDVKGWSMMTEDPGGLSVVHSIKCLCCLNDLPILFMNYFIFGSAWQELIKESNYWLAWISKAMLLTIVFSQYASVNSMSAGCGFCVICIGHIFTKWATHLGGHSSSRNALN